MKVYLKEGNVYCSDEPLEGAEAEWELTPIQEVILRNDGTAELVNGRLAIRPHVAEIVDPVESAAGVTKLDFMNRFTDAELAGIYSAAKVNVGIEIWLAKFNATTPDEHGYSVYLDDPRTIESIQLLEAAGLIATGRAMEILS